MRCGSIWSDLAPAPTKMVANLPYSIATPLLIRTISELPSVGSWVVMVQREIADRLRAEPGSREYGSPSVLVQLACEVTLLRTVDPAVFVPRPRVGSALLRLRRNGPAASEAVARLVRAVVRPPSQVAGPLAGARRVRGRSSRPGGPSRRSGGPPTPAPRRSRPAEFERFAEALARQGAEL